jgi:hypothetical protein
MKKYKILEYFEGTPDEVYDTNSEVTWHWHDEQAICFGFFPISIDNEYELLTSENMHRSIAKEAARRLIGKAFGVISERYEYIDWIEDQCYDKSYALGRYWDFGTDKYPNIMAFWYLPSSRVLKEIVTKLNLDPSKFLLVTEESKNEFDKNITVQEYIKQGNGGDEGKDEINTPFRIDPKVIELIKSYNQPNETWQSRKEKEGWKTLAQRNAMLYQENRQRVDEYFVGDPDTMSEYDDTTKDYIQSWYFNEDPGISFGWFQTSLDGGKEFVSAEDTCHYELTQEIGYKIAGKAIASEYFEDDDINDIGYAVNNTSAFKGRTFSEPKVITTWHKVSSEKLYEILEKLGGIEKFQDYMYVYPEEYNFDKDERTEGGHMNVIDYINSHDSYISSTDANNMKKDIKGSYFLPEWMVDNIRKYNQPNSVLADKTAKLGNMTIAQYNSLIHQEEKKPKQTIKENNIDMKNNKHQEEFSNYLNIMSEALQKEDYNAYDYVKEMLEEAVEDSKHEKELMDEMNTTNFGILNHIFENELPTLIKTNKKAVRDVIKLIKEDKNLSNEFSFYNQIRQYNDRIAEILTPDVFAAKLYENMCIDKKTVVESNKKLMKLMKENNIIPSDFIDDETRQLYESGHNLITKERNLNTVGVLAESSKNICNYIEKHKSDKKLGKDADELVREFEEKLKTNLNESEISFVQQITDFRSPIAEQRKEKLFNKFKNECIDKINEMLKEDANNIELKGLSDQLSEMKFDKNNIVKDIAKLLEIRDILMDD